MVVRMRANRSKVGKRRSHHAITSMRLVRCTCGALRQSHKACPECGMYNGKKVVDVVARAERQSRRVTRRTKTLEATGVTPKESEPAKI